MRKSFVVVSFITALVVLIVVTCTSPTSPIVAGSTVVIPQQFPDSSVTGIRFPTDSNVINGWINDAIFPTSYDSTNIYKHAWGLWAGLTAPTDQQVGGDSLLVFETWMGLNEVQQYIVDDSISCQPGGLRKRGRALLTRPRQFEHAGILARTINLAARKRLEGVSSVQGDTAAVANNLWVTVSYDPNMACYTINNKLFRQSVINKYYKPNGYGQVNPFPNSSLFIKPTYLEYPANAVILQMPVWLNPPNPPDSLNVFDPNTGTQFPFVVYVDVKNRQAKNKTLVPVTPTCRSIDSIVGATCNLTDFINFTVDSTMAAFMNQQDSVQGLSGAGRAEPGNRVLLVAMHVGTKEISNWTWQSYYWTPLPATPGAPSSNLAASLLPSTVQGAARHYAANAAYVMTTPNNSSDIRAGSMFGYNPYLEGGFGPTTFNYPNPYRPAYKYGMQCNCMTCHALAVPSPNGVYASDQYINVPAPIVCKDQVRMDFVWSVQTALISDTIPYWNFAK
ncbi:MAG TPA: hypothetical protein VL727_21960 [Puia sp.]|nr:hypothetical protein [Puia sp.]